MSIHTITRFIKHELDAAGVSYTYEHGGKHPRFVMEKNGKRGTLSFSGTPRVETVAMLRARSRIKRFLEQCQ